MPVFLTKLLRTAGQYSPHKVIAFIFHLPNMVRLCFRLLSDNRVPFHLKLLCYGAIFYVLFPFDLIPDLRSYYLGGIDDIMLLYLAFNKLMKDSPPEVIEEHIADLRGKKLEK
jgi:uncharacterized membrane protein YkvA (DUF1232 family)